MARTLKMNCVAAAMLIAWVVCGCQSTNGKWMAGLKNRSDAKPNFKGMEPEEKEVVTYWPFKSARDKQKVAANTNKFRDKLAQDSEQRKQQSRVAEALKDGDEFRKNGQLEEARAAYAKALKLDPENPDVHHRLAVIADRQGDYSSADEHYQAALKARPKDANLLSDLGYSYSLRGKKDKAEVALKQALEVEPTHKRAMANLGAIYAQQNRYNDALAMCRAGTGSEIEAQQYMSYIASANGSGNGPGSTTPPGGFGPGQSGPSMAANSPETQGDLSKLDFEQIKALMARSREDAVRVRRENDQQRMRNIPTDDGLDQQQRYAANGNSPLMIGPQGPVNQAYANNPQGNPQYNQPTNNSYVADAGRGPTNGYVPYQPPAQNAPYNMAPPNGAANSPNTSSNNVNLAQQYNDSRSAQPYNQGRGNYQSMNAGMANSIQQAGAQRMPPNGANGFPNNGQTSADAGNASQMATRIGMSAGPGGMFPLVSGPDGDAAAANAPSGSFNTNAPQASFSNRFGGEFQQTPGFQHAGNWAGNQSEMAVSAGAQRNDQIDGAPAINPATPSQNWQTPSSGGGLNWQSGTNRSTDWANSNGPGSGAAGSGIDSGVSLLKADEAGSQRMGTTDVTVGTVAAGGQNSNSTSRWRRNNDASRGFSGAWPANNSWTTSVNPGNSAPNGIEMYNGGSNTNPINITPNAPNAPANGSSLPQYPFAPNR